MLLLRWCEHMSVTKGVRSYHEYFDPLCVCKGVLANGKTIHKNGCAKASAMIDNVLYLVLYNLSTN